MSQTVNAPVVLELAPLPREQVGPFLLLGVEKTADNAAVERNWAARLKWARRELIAVPLEDINWARAMLSDPDKRIRADISSLNLDTADGILRELSERFGTNAPAGGSCQLIDVECDLTNYSPPVEMPDMAAVKAGIVIAHMPEDLPGACAILNDFLREPLDPWHCLTAADNAN
jgi:hypothetical protein